MSGNAMKNNWRIRGKDLWMQASSMLRSPKWHKWQRRAAWAVGAWLLLWALAYAAVPFVLKSQLEKMGSEKLGRQLTVGAVDFKPWSLELTIHDLAIAKTGPAKGALPPARPPSPAASPQLKIKRLYIDAELESLWRLAPVADTILVEEPEVSLTYLGQGRYDIDDVLERLNTPTVKPAGEPPQFALYNLEVSGGRMDFVDQSVHKTHELRELHFAMPFLSNLPSKREIKTSPHLAFRLNGSSFDTAAEGTPFAKTRKTDASIALRGLDMKPYLGYWPASLPFRLQSAVLHADVKVAFEQTPATLVRISGTVTADKVLLLDAKTSAPNSTSGTSAQNPASSPELLAFDRLQISMDDVRPLDQFIKLSSVELTAPTLSVTRDRAGQLNLLPPESQNAIKSIASDGRVERTTGQNEQNPQARVAATPAPTPWTIRVDKVALRGGRVNWLDETLAAPARIRLGALTLDASAIAIPFTADAPLQFKGSLGLDPVADSPAAQARSPASSLRQAQDRPGSARTVTGLTKKTVRPEPVEGSSKVAAKAAAPESRARLSFHGTATDQAAKVTASVAAWPLDMAAKYIGQFLLPELSGQLDAELGVNWQAATADQPQGLQITAPQIAVSDVQLAQGKTSLVSVRRVELAQIDIDVPGQTFKAATMQLRQPRARVERGSDQRWMYEHWLVTHGMAAPPPVAPKIDGKTKANTPSWAVAINDVQLDGGSLSFSDKAGAKPVALEVTALKAQLGGLVLDDRPAAKAQAASLMPLSASLRLASGRFEPGKLEFKGSLGLLPLQVKGQLDARRLPAQAFEPYFGEALNIELLRADASFRGRVAYRQTAAGPQAELAGDAALEEFKANTLAPSEELLAWKTLNVRGLNVALEPARATRVDVKETVLSDFFARVIVTPEGRINLQDLLKPAAPAATSSTVGAPQIIAAGARPSGATALKDSQIVASATSAAIAVPVGPPPIVNFGPISLINGQVRFSDRFVKPNYSADLSELTGKLGAFSSLAPRAADGTAAAPAMADLELRGKAEGTAALEITGKLNPLAKPLALDITGKVRDLELPPLSPYAVKYSGYGIERGKLSVDVNYVVLPDGRLTARNKLVLNQLSFGDKVAGSTASLPVKLAVALLADRNGVIDLDLPISGSLNDPQFSLGPIIVKVILNVIVKAITAPFSLLAHALGGGGEELSMVGFPAGSAQLSGEAKSGLDKVAKALVERPALHLTVVGTSSLEAEREGYKRQRLDDLVRAEKRRQMVKEGVKAGEVSVSPADYPALLKEVYQRADLPKPRNLIGLAKDQPVAEMEKLLLAGIKVSDDAMHELAVQRGMAVKDYLASRDLPPDRLFLGAVKAVPPEAKWTPRAELNLAMP
jgi:uncharacterized protein involved in outer membrane biogenesis